MEETFYKRVSVKEELPEKDGNWKVFITDTGAPFCLMWNKALEEWIDTEGDYWEPKYEWGWLKPFPIFSRGKMIEVIYDVIFNWLAEYMPEFKLDLAKHHLSRKIADAILKSGLPEKKVESIKKRCEDDYKKAKTVEIKKRILQTDGSIIAVSNHYDCPNCNKQAIYVEDNFCPNCGVKINWI